MECGVEFKALVPCMGRKASVPSVVTEPQKGLTTLTTRVSELRTLMLLGAIILAVLIYFRSKY
jgi:hypothetical protein